jgi:hypothetical protein
MKYVFWYVATSITGDPSNTPTDIPTPTGDNLLDSVLNITYFFLGFASVVGIILSAIQYATANGNSEKASKAMRNILYSCIGLAVAITAFAITNAIIGGI